MQVSPKRNPDHHLFLDETDTRPLTCWCRNNRYEVLSNKGQGILSFYFADNCVQQLEEQRTYVSRLPLFKRYRKGFP